MRDDRILAFIRGYRDRNGYPPTQTEIAEKFGVTPGAVRKWLKRLEAGGDIETTPGTKRTIRLRRADMKAPPIPMTERKRR